MNINLVKKNKSFGGFTNYFEHDSEITKTKMKFSTFSPNGEVKNAIIWLSGLTCSEENFITKAGVQALLKDSNTMIICPDTSPRGLELPGEHDSYDFGSGAGFYLNAVTNGYADHYRMDDYIVIELRNILREHFGISNISIMGHSMGGHGALVLGLRNPELFKSISAFSPIVNPTQCPWGKKAFAGYFGEQAIQLGKEYDATELLKAGKKHKDTIFIDQGLADEFFEEQLLTEHFIEVAKEVGQEVKVEYREGYDHSYFYIASFLSEHIQFHLNRFN